MEPTVYPTLNLYALAARKPRDYYRANGGLVLPGCTDLNMIMECANMQYGK